MKKQLELLLSDFIESQIIYDETITNNSIENTDLNSHGSSNSLDESMEFNSFTENERDNDMEEVNLVNDFDSSQLNMLYEKFIENRKIIGLLTNNYKLNWNC